MTTNTPTNASISIYSDGSSLGNPGNGGYAWVMVSEDGIINYECGAYEFVTNNRMELLAAARILEFICNSEYKACKEIQIITDSKYVYDGIGYLKSWERSDWKTSTKKPVKNIDLWMQINSMKGLCNFSWKWVKAHGSDKYNNIADFIAQHSANTISKSSVSRCEVLNPELRAKVISRLRDLSASKIPKTHVCSVC